MAGHPLPYITVPDAQPCCPPAGSCGRGRTSTSTSIAVRRRPAQLVCAGHGRGAAAGCRRSLTANRDAAYSGCCARGCWPTTPAYYAFVVPTFETGAARRPRPAIPAARRYATFSGVGAVRGTPAATRRLSRSTTAGTSAPARYGDFEYLVRLLKPQPVDPPGRRPRHGRDQDPGSEHSRHHQPGARRRAAPGRRAAGTRRRPRPGRARAAAGVRELGPAVSRAFQRALAAFINLPDNYAAQSAAAANAASTWVPGASDDPDPLITSPLYGRWHALTQRLLTNRDGTPGAEHRQLGAPAQPRPAVPRARGLRRAAWWRQTRKAT